MRKRAHAFFSLSLLPLVMLALGFCSIAAASLVPAEYRPQSGFIPDGAEHAVAYFMIGSLSALIISPKVARGMIVCLLAVFAGLMELGQIDIPHRSCSLEDFLSSSGGGLAGVLFVVTLQRLSMRRFESAT